MRLSISGAEHTAARVDDLHLDLGTGRLVTPNGAIDLLTSEARTRHAESMIASFEVACGLTPETGRMDDAQFVLALRQVDVCKSLMEAIIAHECLSLILDGPLRVSSISLRGVRSAAARIFSGTTVPARIDETYGPKLARLRSSAVPWAKFASGAPQAKVALDARVVIVSELTNPSSTQTIAALVDGASESTHNVVVLKADWRRHLGEGDSLAAQLRPELPPLRVGRVNHELRARLAEALSAIALPPDVARAIAPALARIGLSTRLALWLRAGAHRRFKAARPSAVVVPTDAHAVSRALVLVARELDIPTLTVQHGLLGAHLGYLPLVSSRFAAWGPGQAETCISMGMPSDRVVIGGAPRLPVASDLGSPTNLVLYAAPPFGATTIAEHLDLLASWARLSPDHQVIVRPHPSAHNAEVLRSMVGRHVRLELSTPGNSLADDLNSVGVVAMGRSSALIDAIVCGRPVIMLQTPAPPSPSPVWREAESAIPTAESLEDFRSAHALVTGADRQAEWERQRAFASRHAAWTGGEAARRVLSLATSR